MKVNLQDSIWVDNFPTLVVVFVGLCVLVCCMNARKWARHITAIALLFATNLCIL